MIPDFSRPLSAFACDYSNPASCIMGQHYGAIDRAIDRFVTLYKEGYDICDEDLFNATLARYGLLGDGFNAERDYILEQVGKELRKLGLL